MNVRLIRLQSVEAALSRDILLRVRHHDQRRFDFREPPNGSIAMNLLIFHHHREMIHTFQPVDGTLRRELGDDSFLERPRGIRLCHGRWV